METLGVERAVLAAESDVADLDGGDVSAFPHLASLWVSDPVGTRFLFAEVA